jgi:hypothetical protein
VSLLDVLPLAVVMVSGPQILSAFFLATSDDWRANSAAYVLGAGLSIGLVVGVAYLLGDRLETGNGGALLGATGRQILLVAVLVFLLYAAIETYRKRTVSEPPQWMGKLSTATPGLSFRLGFLLLGFFPTDVVTSVAVGTYLAATGAPVTDAAGFVFLTLFVLAIPVLGVLALGERAEAVLPAIREWMDEHSWLVSEAVIILFVVLTLRNLLG